MIVLSHRGYWLEPHEKNSPAAFHRSFALGFGTETDVRDCAGSLVISHDPPAAGCLTLQQMLATPAALTLPLAINIKADGLALLVARAMHAVSDWFVFDMSIPDTRAHLAVGNPVFVRMSEVEREPAWLEQAAGIWLDSFGPEWYDRSMIEAMLDAKKKVCVVSPELHGRDSAALWARLAPLAGHPGLMLCTDRPEHARDYFRKTT